MTFDFGAEMVAMLPRLRRLALSLTRNVDSADDLVQTACERALQASTSFTPGTRFDAWMFRIVRNQWMDRLRRSRTRGEEIDVDEMFDLADPRAGTEAEWRLLLADVWPALGTLTPEYREVLILVCVEELSYRDTADVLGVPVGTVMSRLARARRRLAEQLGMNGLEPRYPKAKGRTA